MISIRASTSQLNAILVSAGAPSTSSFDDDTFSRLGTGSAFSACGRMQAKTANGADDAWRSTFVD